MSKTAVLRKFFQFVANASSPIRNSVFDRLDTAVASHGVKVLWAPKGAGKTTSVNRVLRDLHQRHNTRCLLLDANDSPDARVDNWVSDQLGLPRKLSTVGVAHQLFDVLDDGIYSGDKDLKQYFLVVDDIDRWGYHRSSTDHIRCWVERLAWERYDSPVSKMSVLFTTSDIEFTKRIYSKYKPDIQIIPTWYGRWSDKETCNMVERVANDFPNATPLTIEQMRLCKEAANPGLIQAMFQHPTDHDLHQWLASESIEGRREMQKFMEPTQ